MKHVFTDAEISLLEDHNIGIWRLLGTLVGRLEEVAGGIMVSWPESGNPSFNRVMGLGRYGIVTDSTLDVVISRLEQSTAPWWFQIPGDVQDGGLRDHLQARGLSRVAKLPVPALFATDWERPQMDQAITVHTVSREDIPAFVDLLITIFEFSPSVRDWLLLVSAHERVTNYVGLWNDVPVATGVLIEASGVAGLYSGGTVREFRRRGLQSALIATRVKEAIDRGLLMVCSETESAANGSYRNMARQGFSCAMVHENCSR